MEKAYETCVEMLTQRNYTDLDVSETDKITAYKPNGELFGVFFVEALKFNIDCVQKYMSLMNTLHIRHAIVVYLDTLTPSAKKAIQTNKDMCIELFAVKELQYNITTHRLVPPHERTMGEEYEWLHTKFGNSLPKIFKSDPVSRFYHFQKGDIIRITRSNNYIAYRIVVNE